MDFELPRFRPAAGRSRFFLINVERRRRRPFFGIGDRFLVTQVPDIFFRIVSRCNRISLFRPAHDADDIDDTLRRTFRAHGRVLVIVRHKAAIDEDNAAARKTGGCKYPVPGTLYIGTQWRTRGVNECFLPVEKLSRKKYTAKLFAVLTKPCPAGAWRKFFGGAREPRIQRRNQIFLPCPPIKLPDAKPSQNDHADERKHRRVKHSAPALASRPSHTSPLFCRRPSAAL